MQQIQTIVVNKHRLLRKIGSGATADVWQTKKDGKDYALKIYKDFDNTEQKRFLNNELRQTAKINHSSVTVPRDAFTLTEEGNSRNKQTCIAYDLAENGDFYNYLKGFGGFPVPIVRNYMEQLIQAISAIHSADVCHRDLKLENIVLDSTFGIKVIDFGISCPLSGPQGNGFCKEEKVGTLGYMAPEILLECKYQPAMADLFAFGVIIFIMVTGHLPFEEASINDKYYKQIALLDNQAFWRLHEGKNGTTFDQ